MSDIVEGTAKVGVSGTISTGVGALIGSGIGSLIMPGPGTVLGAKIGGYLGCVIGTGYSLSKTTKKKTEYKWSEAVVDGITCGAAGGMVAPGAVIAVGGTMREGIREEKRTSYRFGRNAGYSKGYCNGYKDSGIGIYNPRPEY